MGRLEDHLIDAYDRMREEDVERAKSCLNRALVVDGDNPSVLLAVGRMYDMADNFEKAVEFYKKALDREPKDIRVRLDLARAYFHQNKFQEAIVESKNVLESDPNNLNAKVCLGRSYDGIGKLDEALREYTGAIKIGLTRELTYGWFHLFTSKKHARKIEILDRTLQRIAISQAYLGIITTNFEKGDISSVLKYEMKFTMFKFKTKFMDLLCRLKP